MEKRVALSRARRELSSLLRWIRRTQGRVVIERKGNVVGELAPSRGRGRYTVSVETDGVDAFLPFPADMPSALNWRIGDTIVVERRADGTLVFRQGDRREPL